MKGITYVVTAGLVTTQEEKDLCATCHGKMAFH